MRYISAALALALSAPPVAAQDLAITDVTVVDTRSGALASHQTVTIHEGRIAAIGPAAPRACSGVPSAY